MGNPREEGRNWQPGRDQHVTVFARGGKNGQYGVWVGLANHTNKLRDPGIQTIYSEWWEYLDRTSRLPKELRGVTIEMQKVPEIATPIDPNAELKRGSEMEMIAAEAKIEGIPVGTIEPRRVIASQPKEYVEATYLLDRFSMEAIILYYGMRFGPQMYRTGIVKDPDVQRFLEDRLSGIKKSLSRDERFRGADFSYGTFLENFYIQYGRPFSVRTVDDVDFLRSETFIGDIPPQPELDESPVRQVAREVNRLRDLNSFNQVYKPNWLSGLSNFSIAGEPHLLNQEQDIKSFGTPLFSKSEACV